MKLAPDQWNDIPCFDCGTPCPQCRFRIHLDCSPRKALKLVKKELSRSGFEVMHRVSLSRLAEAQLGVKAQETEVLFLKHPLLLLQYFLTGADAALLLPLVAILRGHDRSTLLCLCSAWSTQELRSSSLSMHLARLTESKLDRAALGLKNVTRPALPGPDATVELHRLPVCGNVVSK